AAGALSCGSPGAAWYPRLLPMTSAKCCLKTGRMALRPAAATTAARLVVCLTRARCPPARPASSQRNRTACPARLGHEPGLGFTARSRRPHRYSSVGRQRGVDLADPGEHATAHMDRVGETRVLHHGEGLGGPLPALAVQHDPPVLREPLQRGTGEKIALGNQRRARDRDDLVFVWLPDVHEEDFIV